MRVVFDMRGLAHAEYLYELGFSDGQPIPPIEAAVSQRVFEQEKSAAKEADAVVCVSDAMAQYLRARFDVPANRITVVPCGVRISTDEPSLHRDQVRERLGLTDRFVVAFCGSTHRWQLPAESARLSRMIQRYDPKAHYLVLSPAPEQMREVLDEAGIPGNSSTILSVPHAEVAHYLAAADVGLLLREKSVVNQVASPVKFAEFLAAGTPVILSEGIGDYSTMVAKHDVGLVLPGAAPSSDVENLVRRFIENLRRDGHAVRSRCRAVAREQLNADDGVSALRCVYAGLMEAMI
jgi:glycosyltransferase involved in cell wall biosynthesis